MNAQLKLLIDDEVEAVKGYDKAILYFNDNVGIVKKLTEIKNDELEHIRELETLAAGDLLGVKIDA